MTGFYSAESDDANGRMALATTEPCAPFILSGLHQHRLERHAGASTRAARPAMSEALTEACPGESQRMTLAAVLFLIAEAS